MKSWEGTGYELQGKSYFIFRFIEVYNFLVNGSMIYDISKDGDISWITFSGYGGDKEDIVKVISDKKLSLIVSYDFIGEYLPETDDLPDGYESVVVTEVYEKGVKVSEDYEVVDNR